MKPDLESLLKMLHNLPPGESVIVSKTPRSNYSIRMANLPVKKPKKPSYIELPFVPCDRKYGIVQITAKTNGFFNGGYKGQFLLRTDRKDFVMHLTSAKDNVPKDKRKGLYLCHPRAMEVSGVFLDECPDADTRDGSFLRFYEAHPELRPGDILRITKNSTKDYRLTIQPKRNRQV